MGRKKTPVSKETDILLWEVIKGCVILIPSTVEILTKGSLLGWGQGVAVSMLSTLGVALVGVTELSVVAAISGQGSETPLIWEQQSVSQRWH